MNNWARPDAVNLAWKLASVLTDQRKMALLLENSYEPETNSLFAKGRLVVGGRSDHRLPRPSPSPASHRSMVRLDIVADCHSMPDIFKFRAVSTLYMFPHRFHKGRG